MSETTDNVTVRLTPDVVYPNVLEMAMRYAVADGEYPKDIGDNAIQWLKALAASRSEGQQAMERAFLAGVEHVAGAEGCGAREGEAAREYVARINSLGWPR